MNGESVVVLRRATAADCRWVWQVNNEPSTRRWSVRQEPIPWPDHERWFAARLVDPDTLLWVATASGQDLGVVRCDLVPATRTAVLSLALVPEQRGRGQGRAAIAAAVRAVFGLPTVDVLVAMIRPANEASCRAFTSVGFVPQATELQHGVELLRTELVRGARQVWFRCDGGTEIGWGHVVRSAALASALAELGCRCTFLMHTVDPPLPALLRAAGHELVVRPDADRAAVAAVLLRDGRAAALVLDSYGLGREFLDGVVEGLHGPRLVIDDLHDRDLRCELVLNGNPAATHADYAAWGVRSQLLGPRWALLRGDLQPARRPPRQLDPALPHVLVTLGGSRLGSAVLDLARAIDALPGRFRVSLLLGAGGAWLAEAGALAAGARHPTEVLQGVPSVAALLATTDLAVAAAGTTCFELAASGVPALLLVVADNQRLVADSWHRLQVFELLGDLGQVAPATVATRVGELLGDREELARRGRLAMQLVDGLGAVRAAQAIVAAIAASSPFPH